MPVEGQERTATKLTVSAVHWDLNYEVAYLWKVDGVKKSTAADFTYTPSANAQGLRTISLYVGTKNSAGEIDLTQTYRTKASAFTVDDTIPATALTMSLGSAAQGAGELWTSSHDIVVSLATGSDLANCESFSGLAMTENNTSAPLEASSYNITCTRNHTQTFNHQLASTGDGIRTLRLWAMDASGNISAAATSVAIHVDTAAPAAPSITGPAVLVGTATPTVTWSSASGANTYTVLVASASGCATPLQSYTDVTTTSQVLTSLSTGTYYLCLSALDWSGNSTVASNSNYSFVVDTTAPTAGTFSASSSIGATGFTLNWAAASDSVTSAANLQYFVCSGASAAAIDTVTECEAATTEMAYTANTLTLAISGKSVSTTYYYNVVVKDAADNKSLYDGKTQATTADTTVPTAGTFSASTGVGPLAFTLNWAQASDNVTSAANLQYFVCSGAAAADIDTVSECEAATTEMAYTANTLTLAISGKTVSTTYYYNVVVKDAADNKSRFLPQICGCKSHVAA